MLQYQLCNSLVVVAGFATLFSSISYISVSNSYIAVNLTQWHKNIIHFQNTEEVVESSQVGECKGDHHSDNGSSVERPPRCFRFKTGDTENEWEKVNSIASISTGQVINIWWT